MIEILTSIGEAQAGQRSPGLQALAAAGARDANEATRKDAKRARAAIATKTRAEVAATAFVILYKIVDELFGAIEKQAPSAHRSQNTGSRRINLGKPTLRIDFLSEGIVVPQNVFPRAGWDVIAFAGIKIQQHEPAYDWEASLWYTNLGKGDHFRWYEASYFENPLLRPDARRHRHKPFFAHPDQADAAHGPVLGRYQVAYGPLPIDDEDMASFCDRWAGLLARASQGELSAPSRLPINEWQR